MRWPWRRHRPEPRHAWSPPAPIPDNDRALHPGDRRSADILRAALEAPTQAQPVYRPLMTPAARWRSRRSAW